MSRKIVILNHRGYLNECKEVIEKLISEGAEPITHSLTQVSYGAAIPTYDLILIYWI